MIGLQSTPSSSSRSSRQLERYDEPLQHLRISSPTTTNPASVIDDQALVPRKIAGLRTLGDVRDQVAQEIAINCITKGKVSDGVRIGVRLLTSRNEDESLLKLVTEHLMHNLTTKEHIFAIGTASLSSGTRGMLIICSSSQVFISRAILLCNSKFMGRIQKEQDLSDRWIAHVDDLGISSFDEDALWDTLLKASQPDVDPFSPPPGSKSIDQILAESRTKLQRITPDQAWKELLESQTHSPTFLVDIRPQAQREKEGGIQGALIVERNVLEWRFDPRCDARLPIANRYDLRIIVFCQEGYTSSLAAYSLLQLGMLNATDIIGGFKAWKDAGLPTTLVNPIIDLPEIPTPVDEVPASPPPLPLPPPRGITRRSIASMAGSMV